MSMLFKCSWTDEEYDAPLNAVLIAGSKETAIARVRKRLKIPDKVGIKAKVVDEMEIFVEG